MLYGSGSVTADTEGLQNSVPGEEFKKEYQIKEEIKVFNFVKQLFKTTLEKE